MAKETNPKNTALEADILKAAEGAVDQKAVKEKATEIAGNAPEGETIPGKVETMQGQPGPGIQLPGSDLPPVTGTGTPATFGNPAPGALADPEYLEFLKWKEQKAAADLAAANINASSPHPDPDGEIKRLNANKLHEDRVKMYGDGYVVAKRQGVEQIFTRQTWKLLGGRNNKDGYIEVVATPPEVAALKKAE